MTPLYPEFTDEAAKRQAAYAAARLRWRQEEFLPWLDERKLVVVAPVAWSPEVADG